MSKFSHIFAALALMGATIATSCNSSTDVETDPLDYSAVSVTAFSLKADKTVLYNLDSVFFSINLNTAQIYNADSLPYGTKVDRLGITLSCSACKEAKLYVPQAEGKDDRVYDFITEADSLIDFSNGPVRFHIVSADGANSRDYFIRVNVHKMVPDSLYWAEIDRTNLPTTFSNVKGQKSVKYKNAVYCLSTDGSTYSMAVSEQPYENTWSKAAVNFGVPVDLRSLTATDNSLYILATSGTLLQSADGFSWTPTTEVWRSIVAGYSDRLLGLKEVNGQLHHAEYPGVVGEVASDKFPVEGASAAARFDTKWSASAQIIISGGRTADGNLSGRTWIFDGSKWALLSSGLPAAEGYSIANYKVCETDTVSWRVKETAVTMAFGGRSANGEVNRTVYLSRDMGVTWKAGDENVQLPAYIPAFANADVIVFDKLLHVGDNGAKANVKGWKSMPLAPAPSYIGMRDVELITEWECPYLYIFGGENASGVLYPYVWRGVVNHLSFRPLQ